MKVYGLRNCRHCKGLCHEGSYRTKHGQRRKYWCGEQCLRQDHSYLDTNLSIEESGFEQVDVITP
jgi:hypothetical protein